MRTLSLSLAVVLTALVSACGRDAPEVELLDLDVEGCEGTQPGQACLTIVYEVKDSIRDKDDIDDSVVITGDDVVRIHGCPKTDKDVARADAFLRESEVTRFIDRMGNRVILA